MSVFTNASATSSPDQARAYTAAVLDLVGTRNPLAVLRETPAAVRRVVDGLSERQLSQREAPGKWSMRHVVRHLADSEIVWGWRLRLVLAQERPALTGYDQDLWADRLGYAEANVAQAIEELALLRRTHVGLLEAAPPADLLRVGVHAERGEESVAHMMRLYAGHDLLHLNQLARIRSAVATLARFDA
jgi:hypothetical protein